MPAAISVTINATPSRPRLTCKSSLMLARNGGAKRKHAFVVSRAMVTAPTLRRVSVGNESSSNNDIGSAVDVVVA